MTAKEKAERILTEVNVEFAGYPDPESVTIKYEDAVIITEVAQAYLDLLEKHDEALQTISWLEDNER